MNSKKSTQNNGNYCQKHSRFRGDEVGHAPTIKCHEEVMSKLSHCVNEDCVGDPNSCIEHFCNENNGKNRKDKVKPVTSKCKFSLHQSTSVLDKKLSGPRHKDTHLKTVKSKSTPLLPSSNLEDSVDIIPVKLTSTCDRKQRPQRKVRHNLGLKEKASKPYRPTWDEILRNNLEVVSKPHTSPSKKPVKSVNTNCNSELSSAISLNKDSLKKTTTFHPDSDAKLLSQKKTSECSKSTESIYSGNLPIFQPMNSSDPIKTLDFLIRQLRDGLLKKPQNNSLQNIILDMENALLKISVDNKSHSNHPLSTDRGEQEQPATISSVPQSAASTSSHEKERVKNRHLDIMQLEQNLEKSCRYLQSLCIKQKENLNNQIREKEQLFLQLAESRRLLAVSKTKEKNYEVTIGDLRLKLQEAITKTEQLKQSLQDLENKNTILKEENEAVTSLKQSLKRASARLKEIASEKEKLQSKLSLKDLEIEKLKVLLQVKTNHKTDMKQDNAPQLDNAFNGNQPVNKNDLSIISLSTVTSWSDGHGLICSSQASSTPRRSPSPYNSWQNISSIVQQPSAAADINRDIAIILQDLKKKSEQMKPPRLELEEPSSCSSLWSDGDKVVYSDGESEGFSS